MRRARAPLKTTQLRPTRLPEKAATDKAGANTGKPRDEAVANKVTALVAASNAKAATELVELKPGFCREPAHYRAQ